MNVTTISSYLPPQASVDSVSSYLNTTLLTTSAVGLATILALGLALRGRPNHLETREVVVEREDRLAAAIQQNSLDPLVQTLADGADPNEALWISVREGNSLTAEYLLKNRANPNHQIPYPLCGEPFLPLQFAAFNERWEILKLLLIHGARIDFPLDNQNNSLLHLDCTTWFFRENHTFGVEWITRLLNTHQTILREELAKRPSSKAIRDRETGLTAITRRKIPIKVLPILHPKAMYPNFNCRNNVGDTPLHQAARHEALDLARRLVEVGAKLDIPNDAGETSRQILEGNGHLQHVLS